MVVKIGIAIYDQDDKWAIILAENTYSNETVYFYKIVPRANSTWLRTGHTAGISYEAGLEGILHVGDLSTEMNRMHGRMQNVYSGEGQGMHANPTRLPWGPRPWVVRALRSLEKEEGLVLPAVPDVQLPVYIMQRIYQLKSMSGIEPRRRCIPLM